MLIGSLQSCPVYTLRFDRFTSSAGRYRKCGTQRNAGRAMHQSNVACCSRLGCICALVYVILC
jgi:hypothetical protein